MHLLPGGGNSVGDGTGLVVVVEGNVVQTEEDTTEVVVASLCKPEKLMISVNMPVIFPILVDGSDCGEVMSNSTEGIVAVSPETGVIASLLE